MTSTKISIVTPSFNQVSFIEETITSVVGQNYANLEYVIIDGGSTDGSDAIIRKYLPHLSHYVSEPDSGHGNALNKGFHHTTGEIMAWLNSDDKYMPWTFKTVAEIFDQHPDIHWMTGTQAFWNDRGTLMYTSQVYKNVLDYLSGNFAWIQQESVFWRRSLWERAGGRIDENYRFMIDGELWCRFFALERLWHVNCVLSGYRIHKGNRARISQNECVAEMKRAIHELRQIVDATTLTPSDTNYLSLRYDFENSAWARIMIPRNQIA
jgi:glycosyltransferase involved in cell wall biosynthesis